MKIGKLRTLFAPHIGEVDAMLTKYLAGLSETPTHYDMIRYHLGVGAERVGGGKRLRAIFCLLIGRAAGADSKAISHLMSAIEMAHSASLVHDDIQDQEATRWGRDTVWKRYGFAQAINAGDAMVAMVYQLLLKLTDTGVPAERVLAVLDLFAAAHMRMAEGQHLDMLYEGRFDITPSEYLDVISRKTAATCEVAAQTSAVVAGLESAHQEALRRFGFAFGMLYQIVDDIVDFWGAEDHQKTELSDFARGKATLPVILGGPELWAQAQVTDSPQRIRSILEDLGVREQCSKLAEDYRDEAHAALDCLQQPNNPSLLLLRQMTDLCLERSGTRDVAQAA